MCPSQRPRLALFCTNFLPYSQSFVYEQLRHYRRYSVDVFAWRRFCADRFPHAAVHLAEPSYIVTRRSRRFARVLRENHFDIAHAHFGPGGTYALPFARRARIPLVVTFHGYDVPLLSSNRRFLPLHLPYALRGPQLLREMRLGLCASTELYELLLAYGVPPRKLTIQRLGIDTEVFTPGSKDAEQPRVVMIGRFVEKKGFEYGINAFARALPRAPTARLTIVGSGPRAAQLRRLVNELGVEHAVTFAGVLPQQQIAALLRRASVLLAPSVVAKDGNRESGLIVVKEASACAAVPIGTLHGGIPESIEEGTTGFLVPERDVEAMAERLTRLLLAPDERARMGAAGRHKMRREFDNQQLVAKLEELYDSLID